VSIWTFLGYILIFATIMLAVVGGIQVLRRLEAQQRLRRELIRMQAQAAARPPVARPATHPPAPEAPSDEVDPNATNAAPAEGADPDARPDADRSEVTGPASGD
jgi:hypothetical protein